LADFDTTNPPQWSQHATNEFGSLTSPTFSENVNKRKHDDTDDDDEDDDYPMATEALT